MTPNFATATSPTPHHLASNGASRVMLTGITDREAMNHSETLIRAAAATSEPLPETIA